MLKEKNNNVEFIVNHVILCIGQMILTMLKKKIIMLSSLLINFFVPYDTLKRHKMHHPLPSFLSKNRQI